MDCTFYPKVVKTLVEKNFRGKPQNLESNSRNLSNSKSFLEQLDSHYSSSNNFSGISKSPDLNTHGFQTLRSEDVEP